MKKLIKISSESCQPCIAYSPVFRDWAYKQNDIQTISYNVEDSPEIASKYRVMSVPTTILLNEEDEVIDIKVGPLTEEQLDEMFEQT